LKFSELANKSVFIENQKIGEVKDLVLDPDTWKVSHLEIELTRNAAIELLGVTPGFGQSARSTLAVSALEDGTACCTDKGVEIKVSKGQLHIYLRPA
jgi:sporulation protein YlmC with PRC-barrel domain